MFFVILLNQLYMVGLTNLRCCKIQAIRFVVPIVNTTETQENEWMVRQQASGSKKGFLVRGASVNL